MSVDNIEQSKPLFSIITVCKNQATDIVETIESVARQDFKNYEHIIIDGKSTDDTLEKIQSHQHSRMRVISESDTGIYNAMNKGIRAAHGEYLLFLNGGDSLFSPDVLSSTSEHLNNRRLVGGDICFLFPDNTEQVENAPTILSENFLLHASLFHPCTFIQRSCFNDLGLYKESYKIAGDYDFFLRCFSAGYSYGKISKTISKFRRDGISSSLTQAKRIRRERASAFIKNIGFIRWLSLKLKLRIAAFR